MHKKNIFIIKYKCVGGGRWLNWLAVCRLTWWSGVRIVLVAPREHFTFHHRSRSWWQGSGAATVATTRWTFHVAPSPSRPNLPVSSQELGSRQPTHGPDGQPRTPTSPSGGGWIRTGASKPPCTQHEDSTHTHSMYTPHTTPPPCIYVQSIRKVE